MHARFDGGRLSSDGGVLLLREIDNGLGLADLLSSRLKDERDPASTTHTQADMIRARLFAIACGYEDCDDLDVLRFDPAFKLARGRLSETGDDLMSHPWCEDVAVRRALSGKDKLRRFLQTGYQAKSWSREPKVVARVEAASKGADIRFSVANLPGRAKVLYEIANHLAWAKKVYCARGRMENMIKDHKLHTKSDRLASGPRRGPGRSASVPR